MEIGKFIKVHLVDSSALWGEKPEVQKQKIMNMSVFLASWMYLMVLILFVLMDAILQKVVYFKNESGTGVVFFYFVHVSYGNN